MSTILTSWFLDSLVRNGVKENMCKGAGAAIMCHLIRNSENTEGEFSPLEFVIYQGEWALIDYAESFGCIFTNQTMLFYCVDPNPPKCQVFPQVYFDANDYFHEVLNLMKEPSAQSKKRQKVETKERPPLDGTRSDIPRAPDSSFLSQIYFDMVSIHAAALIGLLAGSAIAFAVLVVARRPRGRAESQSWPTRRLTVVH